MTAADLPNEQTAGTGNVIIKTKYDGRCRVCAGIIKAGEAVFYNKNLAGSKVWHTICSMNGPSTAQKNILDGLKNRLREKEAEKLAADPADLLATLSKVDEAIKTANQARGISDQALEMATTTSGKLTRVLVALDIVNETYKKLIEAKASEITIVDSSTNTRVDLGLQHKSFPHLLKAASARDHSGHRLNIWISGPAGSGKTSAAKSVAKALQLDFYFTGAIDTEYKLLGFVNAQGSIVSRPFREAWTNGGVFLKDEIDGSHPSALLALNAALANGICDFPDGAVERHPDFVCIAAANTWGQGATVDYVGRTRLDAASLDRFVQMAWPIDEDLERATAPDAEWCLYVQQVRRNLKNRGITGHMITPRATYYGAALLAAGMDRDLVVEMTLKKNLSADQWATIA